MASYDYEAFMWTEAAGIVGLGFLPGARADLSHAFGISGDGSVVVGQSYSHFQNPQPYRWTSQQEMVSLGQLSGIDSYGRSYDASYDGSVVVGFSKVSGENEAFRWTEGTGMVSLGKSLGSGNEYSARAVSADGNTIVGDTYRYFSFGSYEEAFLWTLDDGMVALGHLPDYPKSRARDISSDGNVVVGYCKSLSYETRAFLWTETDDMVDLTSGGAGISAAYGVSGDGTVIVGYAAFGSGGSEAFIWDEAGGMRSLREELVDVCGLDLNGWELDYAEAVSYDGLVIVGGGKNPDGNSEAWVATLPDPGVLLTLTLGIPALLRRRRR
jgi:probable HAF family extracellular repeat protein